jgi:N-acetyl-1-D-myo-inositol-2-amino-2-deoxy-alpha-D-glucopyranoside deacetylase
MRASELAADKNFGTGEPWDIPKIYWNIMPRSVIEEGMRQLKEKGSNLFGTESIDDLPFVKPDDLVSAVIDGSNYVEKKMAALAEHKTQINLDETFFAMRDNSGKSVWGFEYYTQVKGEKSKKVNERGHATDLFA